MASFASQDDGEEEITLAHLRRSVLNEIASPELLPFQQSVVDHFGYQLKEVRLISRPYETFKGVFNLTSTFRLSKRGVAPNLL